MFAVWRLALAEDQDAGGKAGAVEQIRTKADDRFEQVHAEDFLPDLAFRTHAEEGTMRQHHGHTASPRCHGANHVLHPGVVTTFGRRHAGEVPSVGIVAPDLVTPFFEGEGRIGDDAIERRQVIAREERRITQRVATYDLKIRRAMEEEVHPGNGGGGEVFLLAEELAPER